MSLEFPLKSTISWSIKLDCDKKEVRELSNKSKATCGFSKHDWVESNEAVSEILLHVKVDSAGDRHREEFSTQYELHGWVSLLSRSNWANC